MNKLGRVLRAANVTKTEQKWVYRGTECNLYLNLGYLDIRNDRRFNLTRRTNGSRGRSSQVPQLAGEIAPFIKTETRTMTHVQRVC